MSIFKNCPYSDEECIHEIYAGEPRFNLCKMCSVFKNYSSNCDKQVEKNCINKTCVVFKDKEDCVAQLLELEKENKELKEVHESDKRSLRLIAEKGAELEEKISILLSCNSCPDNKGGLLCQKEYEDKCLAQKIQYIKELKEENAELEAKYLQATDEGTSWAHLKSLEQENAELRKRNGKLAGQNASLNRWLGEAITFIKDYMIITIGDHTTVCSVPEENRCINVLKLNERAKSFLKEFE